MKTRKINLLGLFLILANYCFGQFVSQTATNPNANLRHALSLNVGTSTITTYASRLNIFGAGNTNATSALSIFNTSSTTNPIFFVRNDGNVGIGATSPVSRLDIQGGDLNVTGMGRFKAWYTQGTGSAAEIGFDAPSSKAYLISYDRTAFAYKPLELNGSTINIRRGGSPVATNIFVNIDDNVGIGTTTPSKKLQVGNSDGSYALFTSNNNTAYNGGILLSNSPTNYLWKWSPSFNGTQAGSTLKLSLVSASALETDLFTSPFFINGSGNVGINNTAPSARLQVTNGSVLFDGSTGTTPVSGQGSRMMWVPTKSAFRAGYVDGTQWDDASIGYYSTAFGYSQIY